MSDSRQYGQVRSNKVEHIWYAKREIGHTYLYGPLPGFDVLLSRLDAKLHVADVRAELITLGGAVRCSVLRQKWGDTKKNAPHTL